MSQLEFFLPAAKAALSERYVGKSIRDVPTPAAVMDVSAAKRNCDNMLEACKKLGLEWRAHVKTHKTAELTKLQVGDDVDRPVKIVISTHVEAEFLLPVLQEYKSQGRKVNVLYGLPAAPGDVTRLAAVAKALGEGSISVLLDDPAQLPGLASFKSQAGGVVPHAHIKIDMGGRRAGVEVESDRFAQVVEAALAAHREGNIILSGLYSHAGHSYAGDSRVAAMKMMGAELSAMLTGAGRLTTIAKDAGVAVPPLTLSAGASPTALSVQNLLSEGSVDEKDSELHAAASSLSALFDTIRERSHVVEIHAGVYPTLDLQQLAAHSVSTSLVSWKDIAFTVLAEVHSNYPGRGADGRPEVLIGAGIFALGRETCKAYPGMAMVTPWGRKDVEMPTVDVEQYEGWIVGRFSQEHGILTWRSVGEKTSGKGQLQEPDALEVGQKVRLWPNHSCVTGAHFGWYFVVDESREGKEDEIVDIWVRARGW
ncbi:putative alanine racemase domain protein [Phaeoacremonium minimum UCRPA7]|uniref:D-serine dehydratase n=1 Tax=Phaeoacremonium minimum (strain UCR-PA7) TaxID=1286976 RepID=R8BTM5_PHAM7|nr:putative alanine racemase domain protein [Phaeoacremonium minimum UCRPA7]EOO02625.1 putative alanine racemase domain protein [Phaeoacremonium minimum UCRPA7]